MKEINDKLTHDKHPCWFRLAEGQLKTKKDEDAYDEYMNRETYGYPVDTPLSDAVKIFNKETFCNGPNPNHSPLTVNEVIAGAIDEMVNNEHQQTEKNRKESEYLRESALESIWKNKIMPKGSLIVVEGYYDKYERNMYSEGKVEVRCWKVLLYFGLDKRPRGKLDLEPGQISLIRKNCLGIGHKK